MLALKLIALSMQLSEGFMEESYVFSSLLAC
jgi:hypothetical protein